MKKILAFGIAISTVGVFIATNITALSMIIDDTGFAMPKNNIESTLLSDDPIEKDTIQLVEVSSQDPIYEKFNKLYTKDNVELDLNYPIIIRNGEAVKYTNGGAYLISKDFVYAGINSGSTISNQVHYDENGTAMDDMQYIMTLLKSGLYIAHTEFEISGKLLDEQIAKDSVVLFDETKIKVYQYNDGEYILDGINGLQSAVIRFNDVEMYYSEFFNLLNKASERIKIEWENQEDKKDIIEGLVDDFKDNKGDNSNSKNESAKKPESLQGDIGGEEENSDDDSDGGIPYIKPEVYVSASTDLIPWVYTINGDILIQDKSGRILGGICFNVYDEDGNLIFAQAVTASGILEIGPIAPDTIVVIEGYFEYRDENEDIIREECLPLTVLKTLPFEGNVDSINIEQTLNEVSSSKVMGLESLALLNPIDYDPTITDSLENNYKNLLQYIYVLTLKIEDEEGKISSTRINTNQLTALKNGTIIENYQTPSFLAPNSNYKYEFVASDKYGNDFVFLSNHTGKYSTSKEAPKVSINTVSTGIGTLEMDLGFQDEYAAFNGDEYYLTIYYLGEAISIDYEMNGVSKSGVRIPISTVQNTNKILIKNLPYSIPLTAVVEGNYNILDGRGDLKNQEIGKSTFYSSGVPTGTINVSNEFVNIGGTTVTTEISLQQNSTTTLSQILTHLDITFTDGKNTIEYKLSQSVFDSVDVDKHYNTKNGFLVIQEVDRYQKTPGIYLYASKEVIETYGVWQTFLNTALYGSDEKYAGKLKFEWAQGSLTSNTEYAVEIVAGIENIGIEFDVTTSILNNVVTTLKDEPIIYYEDYFISGNFMEVYNMLITDDQNAIKGDTYTLQLWEEDILIDSEIFKKGENIERYRSDMLRAGYEYTLKFIAPEYNLSADNSEVKSQYTMLEYVFDHEEGLVASIELEGLRYAYSGIDTSGDYGYLNNNYTLNKGFDRATEKVVDMEGYFITDYLTYKANSQYYSVIRDFVATNVPLVMSFYDDAYNLLGSTITSGTNMCAHLQAINEYTYPTQFAYTDAAYIRINGTVDKIEAAYYYQYQDKDTEKIFELSDTEKILTGKVPNSNRLSTDSTSTTLSSTVYMACTPGETLNFRSSNYGLTIYFYDDQGVYQCNLSIGRATAGAWLVPTGATQFRIVFATSMIGSKETHEISRVIGSDNMTLEATIKWQLEDHSDDLFFVLGDNNQSTNYTVTKYVNEITNSPRFDNPEYTRSQKISPNNQGHIEVEVTTKEGLDALKAYTYDLGIQYNGREIVLDNLTFNTDDLIYLVRESGDLDMIHFDGYGQYIIMNDIMEKESDSVLNRAFGGTLDFQGYSFTMNYEGAYTAMFRELYRGGVIKNGEIITQADVQERTLVTLNYGDIQNMKFTFNNTIESPITRSMITTNAVSGVIDTFLVEFNGPTMIANEIGVLSTTNNGYIRNGYTYNAQENEGVYINQNGGVISYTSSASSVIESIYADLDLYWNYGEKPSSSTWYSGIISGLGQGRFSNMFGISTRYNYTYDDTTNEISHQGLNTTGGALFGAGSAVDNFDTNYENIYLHSENNTVASSYSEDFEISLLYDESWVENALGSESQFRIRESIMQGFFPLLDMEENIFYSQPFRLLPEVEQIITPEILAISMITDTPEYVDVEFIFNNPSKTLITNINLSTLSATITKQTTRDDLYIVTARLSDPIEYKNEYLMSGFTYKGTDGEETVTHFEYIDAKFYYPIDSIDDLAYLEDYPSSNARLINDLDFSEYSGSWDDIQVGTTFSGTFDGTKFNVAGEEIGNYKLKNVTLKNGEFSGNGLFFADVTGGTISNIDFENIVWENTSGGYASMIHWAIRSQINNVFVNNVELTANTYVSPLAYSITGTDIKDSGVNNAKIRATSNATSFGAAGLVGMAKYSNITHSYVSGLDIVYAPTGNGVSTGAAGILGNTDGAQTRIESCYAIGYIENPIYNGGISAKGTPYIDQCYSDVKIVAQGDYNGGISASTTATNLFISNSFAIGDILVLMNDFTNTRRISVSKNWSGNIANYAYKGQLINNLNIGNDDADALISYENVSDGKAYEDLIGLGSAFDYSSKANGITPKLFDSKGELLNYQEDNYLLDDNVYVKIMDTIINGDSTYTIVVEVDHGNYLVDNLSIENMQFIKEPLVLSSQNGVTQYQLNMRKIYAQDNYKMSTTLTIPNGKENVEIINQVVFSEPLYWEIATAQQWQEVMGYYGKTNQNFRITGTLDFSIIEEPVLNVEVARLVGISLEEAVITGLVIDDTNAGNNESLIYSVSTELRDITFKDNTITLTGDLGDTAKTSFIHSAVGDVDNLIFDNCHISFGTSNGTANVLGMIGTAVNVSNVTVMNSSISGAYQNGYRYLYSGLVAGIGAGRFENIIVKDSEVNATNFGYIGGVVGWMESTGALVNIQGENLEIGGSFFVGGIVGYYKCATTENVSIKDSRVVENYTHTFHNDFSGNKIGGIAGGTSYNYDGSSLDGYAVENVYVKGKRLVGGVTGYGGAINTKINNVEVWGDQNVGGIAGGMDSTLYNLEVANTKVVADTSYAGGITGTIMGTNTRTLTDAHVFDSEIYTGTGAGGIAGNIATTNQTVIQETSVHNSTVTASNITTGGISGLLGTYAGGVIGTMSNDYGGTYSYNYVIDTDISAVNGYAGGLFGTMRGKNISNSYVVGGSVTSELGDYVGGIAGYVTSNTSSQGNLTGLYSATDVSGVNYVGGILGHYALPEGYTSARTFTNLKAYGNVTGNTLVYGIGYFEPELSINCFVQNTSNAVVYEEMLVNGNKVDHTSLVNENNYDYFDIATQEELNSYTQLTNSVAQGGYGSTASVMTNHLSDATNLDGFDVIITNVSNTSYTLKMQEIAVPDGTYQISIYDVKDGTAMVVRDAITVMGKSVNYELNKSLVGSSNSMYIEIFSGATSCGSVYFEGISDSYTYEKIYVDGVEGNYKYSDSNEEITLKVENFNNVQWYKIYEGQGYTVSTKIEVTNYANGSTLCTNLPGVYFAIDQSSGIRSQMFVYETNVQYPILSDTSSVKLPYQMGYTIGENGINDLSRSDLVFTGSTFNMVSRIGRIDVSTFGEAPSIQTLSLEEIDYDVYASGVDSINIEFNDTMEQEDEKILLIVESETEKKEYEVTDRVITLGFNFVEDISITLERSGEQVTETYKSDEIASLVSVHGNDFYYQCLDGVASGEGQFISGEFVSVYQDTAMNNEGIVYCVSSGEVQSEITDHLEIRESQNIYESSYTGVSTNDLQTYKNFTYNETKDVEIETVLFNNAGDVYAISGSTQRKGSGLIADSYLDETYTAYVNDSGDLIEINTELNKPEDLRISGIAEISDTFGSETNIALVRYDYGEVQAFDYVTGESIELEYETSDMGIVEYGMQVLSEISNLFVKEQEYDDSSYVIAKEYIQNLEAASVQELLEIEEKVTNYNDGEMIEGSINTFTESQLENTEYITIYNEQEEKYETFILDELVENTTNTMSVEEKIQIATEAGYEGTLNNMISATKVITTKKDELNVALYIIIILSTTSLLFVLNRKRKS